MPARSSDYGYYRSIYRDQSATLKVLAGDSTTITDVGGAVRNARHTRFVQRITLSVTTDAAQSLTFQDDAGTPVVVGKSAASPGLGLEIVADFGPAGRALTEGKNLDMVISGAGLACIVSVEAYERQTATESVAQSSAA